MHGDENYYCFKLTMAGYASKPSIVYFSATSLKGDGAFSLLKVKRLHVMSCKGRNIAANEGLICHSKPKLLQPTVHNGCRPPQKKTGALPVSKIYPKHQQLHN